MDSKKAFYYVESAPQILSAYKHIQQYGIYKYDMFVRLNGSYHNDSQIQKTLQDLGISVHGNVVARLFGLYFIIKFLKIILSNKYSHFCIADIRSRIGLTAIILSRCDRITLLDDGTASFDYYQLKSEGAYQSMVGFISKVLAWLSSFKLKEITLYTMMPLKSLNGIRVDLCKFELLPITAKRNIEINKNLAVFIGSKVVEACVCSVEHFCSVINRFAHDFSSYKLQYIAHREEDLEKLSSFPQIEIVRLSRPLELEFGIHRPLPAVVCTFYSAGIIHFIPFKEKLKILSYDLPMDSSNMKFHKSILASRDLFNNILRIKIN